jgi:uridine kinase
LVLQANCVYSKVQGVKVGCLNHRFSPFAGGPSGSGKTSFAHKMANIVGCEVVSMESYYKAEEVKDSNYDEFSTLDLPLLLKNVEDIRAQSPTMIPVFDFVKNKRSGSKELAVSEDCGVVRVL